MSTFEEMKETLKKETVLPTVPFEYCLSLAFDDEHQNGYESVMQKFRDIEFIFIAVYNAGYRDGYHNN